LEDAIEKEEVTPLKAFTHEPKVKRLARRRAAEKEAKQAEAHAKKTATRGKPISSSEEDLGALIRQKNAKRMDSLLASLEDKYGATEGKSRKRKAPIPEDGPSEAEFQAIQERMSSRASKASRHS
jgi:DnaJ family protein C protein 9